MADDGDIAPAPHATQDTVHQLLHATRGASPRGDHVDEGVGHLGVKQGTAGQHAVNTKIRQADL